MNVNEVDVLSRNLRRFYRGDSKPFLYIQTGDRAWVLDKDTIVKSSHPYTPRQLSNWLFNWVKE